MKGQEIEDLRRQLIIRNIVDSRKEAELKWKEKLEKARGSAVHHLLKAEVAGISNPTEIHKRKVLQKLTIVDLMKEATEMFGSKTATIIEEENGLEMDIEQQLKLLEQYRAFADSVNVSEIRDYYYNAPWTTSDIKPTIS